MRERQRKRKWWLLREVLLATASHLNPEARRMLMSSCQELCRASVGPTVLHELAMCRGLFRHTQAEAPHRRCAELEAVLAEGLEGQAGLVPCSALEGLWQHGVCLVDGFVEQHTVSEARAFVIADRAAEGQGRGALRWLHPTPHRWRDDRVAWLEGELALDAVRGGEEQLACYGPGAKGYARHRDADASDGSGGPSQGTADRRVTAIVYLSPAWRPQHGGCLRVWPADPAARPLDVEPLPGRLVLFLSGCMDHQVLPVFNDDRVAYTTWFY